MDTLKDIISDIQVFLYGGMATLPLTIAGTMAIIGLFTANYAMLFFLVGYLILVPLAAVLCNKVFDWFGTLSYIGPIIISLFTTKTTDVCRVVIPYSTQNAPEKGQDEIMLFSPWFGMISFFIGYMLNNSVQLYTRETTDGSMTINSDATKDAPKTTNRKTQSMVALVSIIVFALITIYFRYYTSCERFSTALVTLAAGGAAGYSWYTLLSQVGQDRLSDLFGIANRLLPPSALKNGPLACVPVPAITPA